MRAFQNGGGVIGFAGLRLILLVTSVASGPIGDLPLAALCEVVSKLAEQVSALQAEKAALKDGIARLKGFRSRPTLTSKPSGMEQAMIEQPDVWKFSVCWFTHSGDPI